MISEEILKKLLNFRTERDWEQFHTPKNLALSINLEAAELLEIFQWTKEDALIDENKLKELKHEIADIVILINYLANDLDISIDEAVEEKIKINADKYPIAKAKGRSDKYNQLD